MRCQVDSYGLVRSFEEQKVELIAKLALSMSQGFPFRRVHLEGIEFSAFHKGRFAGGTSSRMHKVKATARTAARVTPVEIGFAIEELNISSQSQEPMTPFELNQSSAPLVRGPRIPLQMHIPRLCVEHRHHFADRVGHGLKGWQRLLPPLRFPQVREEPHGNHESFLRRLCSKVADVPEEQREYLQLSSEDCLRAKAAASESPLQTTQGMVEVHDFAESHFGRYSGT
jgi:hypothetical protein